LIGPLHGKTILEIGAGDTVALAPLFIGAGAERYVVIDRFLGAVDGQAAKRIYSELEKIAFVPREWWDKLSIHRTSIEKAAQPHSEMVDVIISFNVLEHLSDLSVAFKQMAKLLKRDGMMVHRIDYGPHDIWRSYENLLEFLTVPDWLWSLMGRNRGYPNRIRHGQVLRMLIDAGFVTHASIGQTVQAVDVHRVKNRLTGSLSACSDEELAVLDAELVSKRRC
jgi:SAM-dependent methyltransferase